MKRSQVIKTVKLDGILYKLLLIKCGKSPCRTCEIDGGHGPYWYAFRNINGNVIKTYVGKNFVNLRSEEGSNFLKQQGKNRKSRQLKKWNAEMEQATEERENYERTQNYEKNESL